MTEPWINVMAWGVAYALTAWHPGARKPVLVAGALGKLVRPSVQAHP